MRFRFPTMDAEKEFIQALADEHFDWSYGRKHTEIFTGKLPESLIQKAEELKADYDDK